MYQVSDAALKPSKTSKKLPQLFGYRIEDDVIMTLDDVTSSSPSLSKRRTEEKEEPFSSSPFHILSPHLFLFSRGSLEDIMEAEENQSALVPKLYTVLMETIMKNNGTDRRKKQEERGRSKKQEAARRRKKKKQARQRRRNKKQEASSRSKKQEEAKIRSKKHEEGARSERTKKQEAKRKKTEANLHLFHAPTLPPPVAGPTTEGVFRLSAEMAAVSQLRAQLEKRNYQISIRYELNIFFWSSYD